MNGSAQCGQLVVRRNMFTFSLCCPQQPPYQIKQLRNTAMTQWPLCVCVLYLLPGALDTILVILDMGEHTCTHTYIHIREHTHLQSQICQYRMDQRCLILLCPPAARRQISYYWLTPETCAGSMDQNLIDTGKGDTGGYIKVDRIKLMWKIQLKGTSNLHFSSVTCFWNSSFSLSVRSQARQSRHFTYIYNNLALKHWNIYI